MIRDLTSRLKDHRNPLLFLAATWGVYFTVLFARLLEWGPEGLYAGHTNIWSDWSAHIGMANIFAYKSPGDWLAYHPYYSAGKFTYPFLTNLISGVLVRMGVPLVSAMVVPSIVYSFLLLGGVYLLVYTLLKSRRQAVLTLFLFLLSSGAGFLIFFSALFRDFNWKSIFFPPIDFSAVPESQWYAGNVIEGLIAPQRAFLLGMVIGVWALYGLFRGLEVIEGLDLLKTKMTQTVAKEKSKKVTLAKRYWLFSGLLIGLLPFTHVHSLIAVAPGVGMVVLYQFVRRPAMAKPLLYLILPAALLGLLYYLIILRGGIQNGSFQTWNPGWTSEGGLLGWLTLWTKIWGLALPLTLWAFYGFLRRGSSPSHKLFITSFFLLFGLANLIFFQPTAWDNSKIFFWCYLFFCCLMSIELDRLWNRTEIWAKSFALLLAISLTGTGLMEVYRMQWISKGQALMTANEDIELGKTLREKTGPRDIFLTAPTHNHFVTMWAVRPILLGYTGWVWNYGFLYQDTENDMKVMFQGGQETPALLAKHHIRYVVIGDEELRSQNANEMYYAKNFRQVFANNNYRIYDVQ